MVAAAAGSPFADLGEPIAATIAAGASLSAAVNIQGKVIVGIQIPASWSAANLSFQAAYDGATFVEVYDGAGNAISVVVAAASTFILIDPSLWAGVKWLKVRSGTSGSPVNQTVNPIQLIVRPVA